MRERDECPECGGDSWYLDSEEGEWFCAECDWPREDDEPMQGMCDGTCDTCNCELWDEEADVNE